MNKHDGDIAYAILKTVAKKKLQSPLGSLIHEFSSDVLSAREITALIQRIFYEVVEEELVKLAKK